jgi:hypothetical protein
MQTLEISFVILSLQTLVSKGPQHAARGPLVLQGFQNPDAAVASAASNAAGAKPVVSVWCT